MNGSKQKKINGTDFVTSLDETEIKMFEDLLLKEKKRLEKRCSQAEEDLKKLEVDSDADEKRSLSFQESKDIYQNQMSNANKGLISVLKRLEALNNGKFDQCSSCGETISLPRLKAALYSSKHVMCKI